MKKILFLLLAGLLITSNAWAEILDQSQTGIDGNYIMGDYLNVEYRYAQSFQLSADLIVTSVVVRRGIQESAEPSGNWTLRIETNSVTVPSGTLANANASIVVTPPAVNTEVTGTFATPFALSGSTTYWLVPQCDNQSTSVFWDFSRNSVGSSYANGNDAFSANGVWTPIDGDMYFKIYVQEAAAAPLNQIIWLD